ncbi:Fe-only nitrogenase accessory AnfO family protein [Clostridium magnum]|uniref:Iron only nitrogenase protein AnfO n=1 Tax=Clostridium magnum DSM 2767 TaxID=1121326 RepID=A0A162SJN5_9CLOT|nr:Fe-only nitrogenase accessory AnfO family protein [Clostridium magnum]KZL91364.1 iron only nitrogenase protein AnfO [Clostridium magnum DSM 2767]SHH39651.1 Iron only nitrogenase protein AnfO (AnfO_nitrog) [Clostridium magnum DSM 2767]
MNNETILKPIKNGDDGSYYIDLRIITENNEKITSKQVLLPFFHNTVFKELEITCDHIPPWFGMELKQLNLQFYSEPIEETGFKVKVYPIDYQI